MLCLHNMGTKHERLAVMRGQTKQIEILLLRFQRGD